MIPDNPCKEIKLPVPLTYDEYQWMLSWVNSEVFHDLDVYYIIEDIVWQLTGSRNYPLKHNSKSTVLYLCEGWLPDLRSYKKSEHWKTLDRIADKLFDAVNKYRGEIPCTNHELN